MKWKDSNHDGIAHKPAGTADCSLECRRDVARSDPSLDATDSMGSLLAAGSELGQAFPGSGFGGMDRGPFDRLDDDSGLECRRSSRVRTTSLVWIARRKRRRQDSLRCVSADDHDAVRVRSIVRRLRFTGNISRPGPRRRPP